MNDILLNFEDNKKETNRAKELYQLLSSYEAYIYLLLKAKMEYENNNQTTKGYYSYSNCYEKYIANLFSKFEKNECIFGTAIEQPNTNDIIFLLDNDTLLKINSQKKDNLEFDSLAKIDYKILKINNCYARSYVKNFYCADEYVFNYHWEGREAFGLFNNGSLITPSYVSNKRLMQHDNMNIRDILDIQSIDNIYEKITEAKEENVKKLSLKK